MKKIVVLLVLAIGILNADWERVVGVSDEPVSPLKTTIKSDSLGVCIQTVVFGFTEDDTTIDGKYFRRIKIPEEPVKRDTADVGKPEIPFVRLLIAIPDSADVETKLYRSDCTEYSDYLVYPIPQVIFEDSGGYSWYKEVYAYDTTFYQKDTLYPDIFYEVGTDGYLRGQRVLEVFLYPIQFNPLENKMYFHHELDLRIDFSGTIVENTLGLGPFEEMGREVLLNYPGIDRQPPPHDPPSVHYYTNLLDTNNVADYLIVTHDDFLNNETASYWIEQLAEWRVDHNEFDIAIVKTSDIFDYWAPSDTDSLHIPLREFLMYAFDHWHAPAMSDGHLAYCLFIGDWDYVPTHLVEKAVHSGGLAAQDGYFRDLSTPPDTIEEIMLGRWPVKETNIADLVTIAQKTIDYENSPLLGNWRRSGILIAPGSDEWEDFDSLVTYSTPFFDDIGYDTVTVRWSQIQNIPALAESIDCHLTEGTLITSYYGHGAPDGWWYYDTSHVKRLRNGPRLPVVFSHACQTARFHWDHPFYGPEPPRRVSVSEHFLINPDGGAVAFYGVTWFCSIHFLDNGMEILNRIMRQQYWTLGQALVNLPYISHANNPDESLESCLLGDPALDLGDYTACPTMPDLVVRPRGIDIGMQNPYPYPVTNDIIPIAVKILNIGATNAQNVDFCFTVTNPDQIEVHTDTVTVQEIASLDTAIVVSNWNTQAIYPDFIGDLGNMSITIEVDPGNEIVESWEKNNEASTEMRVALYPPGWTKQVRQLCGQVEKVSALANLDESEAVEIIFAGLDSVYVFNADGTNYDGWPIYFRDVYGVLVADIDANGWSDIVAVSEDTIKTYFNNGGNIVSGWAQPVLEDYEFVGLPAAGHVRESGTSDVLDIVILARPLYSDNHLKVTVYAYSGGSPTHIWQSSAVVSCEQTLFGGPSVENLISSGGDEIVIAYRNRNHPFTARTDFFNEEDPYLHISLDNYGRAEMIPALADINDDYHPDVLTCAKVGGILLAYDAWNNDTIWKTTHLSGTVRNSPAVGNISERYPSTLEITYGVTDKQRMVRGPNGYDHIGWPLYHDETIHTSPALARLEGRGDAYTDIIFGSINGLHALNYELDSVEVPLQVFGLPNSVVVGDIDGDRRSERVMYSDDGYLHVWENSRRSVLPYELEWPQFQHDHQRTGLYGWISELRGGEVSPVEFSAATTLSFSLLDTLHTKVAVYDSDGNPIKTLVDQILPSGTYHPVWHGNDNNYVLLPDGVYFIEIRVRNETKVIPVIIDR